MLGFHLQSLTYQLDHNISRTRSPSSSCTLFGVSLYSTRIAGRRWRNIQNDECSYKNMGWRLWNLLRDKLSLQIQSHENNNRKRRKEKKRNHLRRSDQKEVSNDKYAYEIGQRNATIRIGFSSFSELDENNGNDVTFEVIVILLTG